VRKALLLICGLVVVWQVQPASAINPDTNKPTDESPPVRLDDALFGAKPPLGTEASQQIVEAMYKSVASDDSKSLAYLHEVFETFPEWRNLIAETISKYALERRRRPQDWRLLVRSLEVVEGQRARQVIAALLRFRERSTKPRWIRQVIVLGLEFGDDGAKDAIALLERWSDRRESEPSDTWKQGLAKWQAWYSISFPDQPIATLPQLPSESKWQYGQLRDYIYGKEQWQGDAARGKLAYYKADCRKCHRFGQSGEAIGPDLTQIADRMQRKQSLRAIMFPSEIVPDQYLTYSIITTDGRTFTGIIGKAEGNNVAVLQADGTKVTIDRKEIEESLLRKESAMPQGTLDRLSKQEIADLFAYMHSESASGP
jgi:putative heme-binding domain-containing protein